MEDGRRTQSRHRLSSQLPAGRAEKAPGDGGYGGYGGGGGGRRRPHAASSRGLSLLPTRGSSLGRAAPAAYFTLLVSLFLVSGLAISPIAQAQAATSVGIPMLASIGAFAGVTDTAEEFARSLKEETGGKVFISNITYDLARDVVFRAVREGRAIGLGAPGNYANFTGVDPRTIQYLQNDVPFAMSFPQFDAFLRQANFSRYWDQVYKPFGIRPYHAGTVSGAQLGGWFKKPITKLGDFRGLTIRYTGNPITAFQGMILSEVGATPIAVPAPDIKAALANGTLDGVEVLGPVADEAAAYWESGARVLHYPSFQGPESTHFLVPDAVVAMATDKAVRRAAQDAVSLNSAVFYGPRAQAALDRFRGKGVTIRRLPVPVVQGLYRAFKKVEARHRAEVGRSNPLFAQIIDEYNAYLKSTINHSVLSAPEAQQLPARDDIVARFIGVQPTVAQQRAELCRRV
ncbi:hypothetical protein CBR_g77467 [Chara braunii]|uniref:TRAP transporter substrate-binding protein n=1 Tax=Chara braunii TaxID=69332 RepID=A0A388JKK0_CHABU|nr:hypothetical protein CBR_g77467 [Chara braunii]|eukprot:GBG43910.1 hypothetical protein CBR_g77467 [Chara braunii]